VSDEPPQLEYANPKSDFVRPPGGYWIWKHWRGFSLAAPLLVLFVVAGVSFGGAYPPSNEDQILASGLLFTGFAFSVVLTRRRDWRVPAVIWAMVYGLPVSGIVYNDFDRWLRWVLGRP
jgi:hypothetical protein